MSLPTCFCFKIFTDQVFSLAQYIALSFKVQLVFRFCIRTQHFPILQAELYLQQSSMLEKLSSIKDNKLDSMKRQLDEASTTQMSELKKICLTEPHTLKKKRHKQQYKHNQQVKSIVSEAKDAVTSRTKRTYTSSS